MQWLPPPGMRGRALEYDFREGGRYEIELVYEDESGDYGKTTGQSDVSRGKFLTLEPGRRIVQSVQFESDDPAFGGEMRLTWSLEPVDGGTRVTVVAENVPPGISARDHEQGLNASLKNLTQLLS